MTSNSKYTILRKNRSKKYKIILRISKFLIISTSVIPQIRTFIQYYLTVPPMESSLWTPRKKCAIPCYASGELIDNYCMSGAAHIYLFPSKWCHGFSYSYAFICIKGICGLREAALLFICKLKLLNNRFSMVLLKMVDTKRNYFSILQLFSFF